MAVCTTCTVYDESLLTAGAAGSSGTAFASSGAGASSAGSDSSKAPQGGQAATGGMTPGGTSGASTSAGGSGGSGGMGGGMGGEPTAGSAGDRPGGAGGGEPYELIDDMEDDDRFVLTGTGRDGYWQTENDGTVGSTQTPPMGAAFTMTDLAVAGAPREGSLYAAGMHVTGFVGSTWGALMVASMRASGESIDASAFCGLAFWARRGAGTAELVLRVVDKHSAPAGGLCIDSETPGDQGCFDDFHISVALTSEWAEKTVRFADLVQWGFGYASASGEIDSAAIHGIVFSVDEAPDFEVLIDDLRFVRNGFCE